MTNRDGEAMERIELVMAVDAIIHPLTGIGRYAYELLRRVQRHPTVGEIRYFSLGRFVDDPCPAVLARSVGAAPHDGMALTPRAILARSGLAVAAYGRISPPLFRWRLRKFKGAVFHAPNFFVPSVPGATVSTVHDLSHVIDPDFHPPERVRYMDRAFEASLRHTDYIVTVSESVRSEVMERLGWPADRVVAIHNGVGDEFKPARRDDLQQMLSQFGLTAGAYTLFVGTVEPRKNVDRLMDAYASLPADMRHEWPLVIVGGKGWKSEHTHSRMAAAESQGWLKYLRYVPQSVLPALYAGARLFAYPSLYEGFGLPIVEAMASGVPVVTSNVSCMPEIAGQAARLVDPLDVDDLREALSQGLLNTAWRERAILTGLERARDFSWQSCADRTVAVYEKAKRG